MERSRMPATRRRVPGLTPAGARSQPVAGAQVIDGAGAFLMPGMVEAHTHFAWNNSATLDGIQDHVQKHLASFKRPEKFHVTEELPRTSTGKLLRRHLIPLLEDMGL